MGTFTVGKSIGIIITIIIAALLFVALQPGSIFTVPGNEGSIDFFKRTTNNSARIVHMIIFTIAFGGVLFIDQLLLYPVIVSIFGE
jgi:hypothetical protein